ncbi:MAG: Gfo/Idh/MocA family oxidoreductase, partial [Spirochaetota bacterium]
ILLEKPVAPTIEECLLLETAAKDYSRTICVAHVLRYTTFFQSIKDLIRANAIGKIRGIQHNENIGHIHFAHSFVRGNWSRRGTSSPTILAKSCHDLDILLDIVDAESAQVSSFGSSGSFSAANCPVGAPTHCLDGCPHASSCPYYAPSIYLKGDVDWPVNVVTTDLSPDGIRAALRTGPYGRCVYRCDNDAIEHQVVNFRFKNDVTAVFTMSAFTKETSRTLKIVGEKGEIRGALEKQELEVFDFVSGKTHRIILDTPKSGNGHAGGDESLMEHLIQHIRWPERIPLDTGLSSAIQSHVMAFAAEESRMTGKVIDLESFRRSCEEVR